MSLEVDLDMKIGYKVWHFQHRLFRGYIDGVFEKETKSVRPPRVVPNRRGQKEEQRQEGIDIDRDAMQNNPVA